MKHQCFLVATAISISLQYVSISNAQRSDAAPDGVKYIEDMNYPGLPSSLTIDGFTYQDVRWDRLTPAAVTIFHKTGVATIPLSKLPPELQKQFGYDPRVAAAWEEARSKKSLEQSGQIKVLRAVWGAEKKWVEVTSVIQGMLASGTSNIDASVSTFGDPVPGQSKVLRVTYELQGTQSTESTGEGASLDLSAMQPPLPAGGGLPEGTGLKILKATYGINNQVVDITQQLQSLVVSNALSAGLARDVCHCDPAVGQRKKTTVAFLYGGRRMQKEFGESESVDLPKH